MTLDAAGEPVRPAVLWNDTRSAPDAEAPVGGLGGPEAGRADRERARWPRSRSPAGPGCAAVEPEAAAATPDDPAAARLPHRAALRPRRDRPRRRLGHRLVVDRRPSATTRRCSASTPSGSTRPSCRGARAARRAGRCGRTWPTSSACRRTAWSAPGTGDNMGAALALGLEPGTPVVSLGTSGTAYAAMHRRAADPTGIVAGFADAAGGFLPLACTLNATLAVDRVAACWVSTATPSSRPGRSWCSRSSTASARRTSPTPRPRSAGCGTTPLPARS